MISSLNKYEQSKCWEWPGATRTTARGKYGVIREGGKLWQATHWFFIRFRRTIPKGTILHHVCENKICVNPWHLKPEFSQKEHAQEHLESYRANGLKRRTTHCKRGHERNAENCYLTTDGKFKNCRICMKERYEASK